MSFIFKRKLIAFAAFMLLLFTAALFSGCRKGYNEYWPKGNPKTGFIYDKVKSDSNFTIFAAGLERAGLVKYVNVSGLYTVFAPTNEAFRKYFAKKGVSSINEISEDELFSTLSYHVATNMWYHYDFITRYNTSKKTTYITRTWKFINVDVSAPDVFKVNGIPVISALEDIDAENGVIHGIGEVIIPLPNLEQTLSAFFGTSMFYQMMQNLKDKAYDRFNSRDVDRDGRIDSVFYITYPLLSNVYTSREFIANSAPESQGGDPVFTTFLIPGDAALKTCLDTILPRFENDITKLPRIFQKTLLEAYYIKDSTVSASQLVARPVKLLSANGETLPPLTAGQLVLKDISASNGIIHGINHLFPTAPRLKTAIGTIMINPELTDFVEAINSASLLSAYGIASKAATFFAPTNAAFRNAGIDVRQKTLNGEKLTDAQFINIVKQHVISSNLTRDALTGSKTTDYANNPLVFTSANGVVTVTSNGGVSETVGQLFRGAPDVTNGYVYKIEKVLMPATY